MNSRSSPLHPFETRILHLVGKEGSITVEAIAEKAHLTIDQVRRGVERLKFKKLVTVSQYVSVLFELGERGKSALTKGLPERRLVRAIQATPKTGIASIAKTEAFEKDELGAAIRIARDQNHWLIRSDGIGNEFILKTTKPLLEASPEERVIERFQMTRQLSLSDLNEIEKKGVELLRKRPDYLKEIKNQIITVSLSGKSKDGKEAILETSTPGLMTEEMGSLDKVVLDLQAAVKTPFLGKTHPLTDLIEEIKEIFLCLGFSEIEGDFIQTSFWNFDALFTLQNHPAREMQDTFYISGLANEGEIASREQLRAVSREHNKNSSHLWDIQEAKRLVLRTHTTPVTLRYLANTRPEEAKIFSVGTVFRNEKVTKGHLSEFYQIEGVVTKPDASMRDLIGLQLEFYKKLGIEKVKFWPTFFPYTEPSLQSMVYNERINKWMELFGMGIFRDEVTRPLKILNPVLAWGGGLERLAMLRLGIDDMRTLYSNKIDWLRRIPKCQL